MGTRRRFSPWTGTGPVGIAVRLIAFGVFLLGVVPATAQAADDYAANTSTTGTVVVGGSQTGELESHGDVDWIRVALVGGTRYVIDYDGSANGQGTLSDPYFRGVYDANGNLISGTADDNGGLGLNSRMDFRAGSSGTYFLGLGNSAPSLTGTYRVSVTVFDDYVAEVIIPGDDYAGDITTTGSVSVGGSAVGNFQQARGDSDWIRPTTDSSSWYYLDHDWFRVTFDAGKTYRVHIKGSWTNHGTLRDTRIAGIYDSNGNLIASTVDDNSGIDKEARTIFTASTTGTHYISATRGEFPFPAQDSGTYTVEVYEIGNDDYAASTATSGSVAVDGSTTGTIERMGDLDWFAVTLEGYATYRFDLEGAEGEWPLLEGKFIQGIYDSNGNGFAGTYTPERRDDEVRAVFAPEQDGTYYVAVGAAEKFTGTGKYLLSATKFIPEVSDWLDTKGRVGVGSYVDGAIEEAFDRDWFRVTLEAGTTYQVDLEGSPTSQGTLRDPYLHGIRDSQGTLISNTSDDNSGVGMNSRVNFTPDSDGTYYIEAGALFGRTGTYRLSVWQETSDDEPLTASYPASAFTSKRHTGSDDRPQVVVAFSEAVAEFAANTSSVSVTGASGLSVQPHTEDGLENAYIFLMTPDGDGDIEFALLADVACDAGGICAADGGLLSNNPSTNIPGPSVGEPALSVSDASANETEGSIDFAVTLSPAASATVTVDYATADGTATAGADYTATSGTLTFQTGDTQKTISVPIIDDSVEDDGETLTLTLSNASGATLADAEATGTIHNTEVTEPDPLTASFSGAPAEHDGGSAFIFQVQFSEDVGISYVTLRDDAFEVDEGEVTGARRVDGRHDLWEITVKPDGSADVAITLPGGRTCGTTGAVCTRGEDPRPLSNSPAATVAGPTAAVVPTVAIADARGTEGDGDIGFAVTLDRAGTDTVTVDYATSDGTATAGEDYTAASGTLTFTAGDTAKTISVPILDDAVDDGGETFTLTLSNASSGVQLGDATATGTIDDNDDGLPAVSVSDAGAAEGGSVAFTVSLSVASSQQVTVQYATSGGTATSGTDFTAESGTLTFTAGETSKTLSVATTEDSVDEADETFTLTLSSPVNATLADATATGTINDDDNPPAVTGFTLVDAGTDTDIGLIADGASFTFADPANGSYGIRAEAAADAQIGSLRLALSGAATASRTENWAPYSLYGDDGVNVAGEGLPAGSYSLTATAYAQTGGSGAELGTLSVSFTVSASQAVVPTVAIADAGGTEGDGDIGFAVTLDSAASGTVTVDYATSNGTADDDDYTATNGTLTFAAGDTSKTVSVAIGDDDVNEDDETFTVTLSNASGATLGTSTATGTIRNRYITPTVSISGGSGKEGDDSAIAFTVTLDRTGANTVTVDYATANGTADGNDYTATSGTLSFAAGETEKVFSVAIGDDDVNESDETFTVTLSNASGATLGTSTATGTIRNRYITPTASISGGSGKEGDDSAIAFTVTLDRTAGSTVTVDYTTADGTADSDDYTATSGTLSFTAGETSKTVSVSISDDVVNESDETFTVTLSNPSGATLGTSSATGTIENRQVAPLTASFEQVPAEHDGTTFVFHVRFSEDPAVSYLVLRDESFGVTGGEVVAARRKHGRDDLRDIHVQPSGHGDVTVSLPPTTDCDADGAICTADGRPLSNANAATVRAMPALSVADATATEGAGATLDFAVTLSRAASGPVTVAYATADGTAVAGSDYTAVSDTLSFAAGETSKTVQVALLDDSVDDDGETLTLTLSNPSGARLADATATGTIDNSDPVPQAWLARFGRTAADHAIDAIGVRFESGQERAHATFAGWRLWGDAPGADPLDADNDPFGLGTGIGSGLGHAASPYARQPGTYGAQPGMGMNAGSGMGMNGMSAGGGMNAGTGMNGGMGGGMNAGAGMGPGGGMGTGMGVSGAGGGPFGPPAMGGHRPALRDLLIGSSFLLSASGTDDAGGGRQLTAWGRASATRFDGAEDDVRLSGDVATFLIGADAAWDRWLAGISVAHTIGSGGFSGVADEGELDSTLTALHPYVRVQATDRLSAWGVLGYGAGALKLETGDSAWRTDTSMSMAAAGLRGVLLSTDAGFELAAKTDVRFTHIGSDAAVGDAGLLGETSGGTSRVRLLLEGTRPFAFGPSRQLTPSLQLGVRRDGGDAENGNGFDLGGTLRYADAALGLSVEASGRYLLAHEDSAYREWGASASIRVDPGIPGRGLTLSVAPSWGADASGGAERLWSARDARGLAGYGFDTAMRLQAQVGYGLSAFRGKGSMTPFAALSSSGPSGRELRAGALWARGQSLQMSLAGTRREAAGERPAHGVEFRLTWRPGAREGYPGATSGGLGMAAPCPADGARPAEGDGEAACGLRAAEADVLDVPGEAAFGKGVQ